MEPCEQTIVLISINLLVCSFSCDFERKYLYKTQMVDAILVGMIMEYQSNEYTVSSLSSLLVTSIVARYKLFSAQMTQIPCLAESRGVQSVRMS